MVAVAVAQVSALAAAWQQVRRTQEPLRLARRRFATLQIRANLETDAEPLEDAPRGEWDAYCERVGEEVAEALGLGAARQAVRNAVETVASAGGVAAVDVAELRRGRRLVRYRAAMLGLGMRLA